MQKITPFFWFDSQAEEAANFYVSVFKNSKILNVSRYDAASAKAAGRPAGSVLTVAFSLDGHTFNALNGGPIFKFTEAVSFAVSCETQDEIDYYWDKLSAGGEEQPCGWLKDKFGLSWQVVPSALGKLLSDPDPKKSQRVMEALLRMKKLDLKALERAYDQS
jgi:predicted 3-demethylubiquinone-9 3-methyltransferase (glyoxalase superfamily)